MRVTRPGVEVRARRGYRASRPEETRVPAPAPPVDPRAVAVAGAMATLAGAMDEESARLHTSAWSRAGAGQQPHGMFWIAGELDERPRRNADVRDQVSARVVVDAPGGAPLTSSVVPLAGGSRVFVLRVPEGATPAGPGAYRVRVSFVDG